MKQFCLRQMRREYRGVLRSCTGTAIVFLLCLGFMGAISAVNHVPLKAIWALIGIEAFVGLVSLGLYMIFSDEKWLLKKTPFGQALYSLGKPREVMRDIDRAAEAFYEHHGSFILLRGWLVLLLPDGWRLEPYRMTAYPIRRGDIREIRLLNDTAPDDPEERHVLLTCSAGTEDFYLYQQQDVDALRNWMEEGGISIDE